MDYKIYVFRINYIIACCESKLKTGARYICLYLQYSVARLRPNVFSTISERWHKLMVKFNPLNAELNPICHLPA
jgi:hypothetical protein